MRFPLPADPTRRAFVIAVVCSILLHILLLGSLVWVNTLGVPAYARRGEPLIVDIAPDKPEEKAPLGNPARPPGSQTTEPAKAAELPAPKPKITPAPPSLPRAPAPAKASPRRPEPPKQVAKAAPPPPELPAKAPEPPPPAPAPATPPREPEPPAQQPPPTAQPQPAETAKSPGPSPSSAPSTGSERTALAKPPSEPPASIFRYPGGGGGPYGGRGGRAGEPIPLDTPDPNYREYMEKVKQRIYSKWGYPYEAQSRGLQGKLVIEFHIAKDGHLQFIELRQSSGEEILDSFAMTAVKLGQVYPPLPDAMRREVLPIVAVFIYTMRGPLSILQSLQ